MPRSFKLKFFLLVTVAIVFFAMVARISVRQSSTKPIHELLYANFAGFLALNVDDFNRADLAAFAKPSQQTETEQLTHLANQLRHYFPELGAEQMFVWTSNASDVKFQSLTQAAQWRTLRNSKPSETIELAEVHSDANTWVVFKVKLSGRDVLVAITEQAFRRRFSDIMDARESILNNMWPILLAYIFLCTWFLTSWVMRSLNNLQNHFKFIELKGQAANLSEKDFDVEFGSFVRYFNSLIGRLQNNFEQASRFSSDAAHELRTPLTVIRGNLKRLLNRAPDNSPEQIQLSMLSDEVERLISITNKLVLLSQADGDNFQLDLQAIKLFDVIAVIGEDIQSLVSHVEFEYSLNPDIHVLADPSLFQQLLNNLISNAIKYSPPQGKIKFKANQNGEMVVFSLSNSTYLAMDGLDDRIFSRFYRHLNDPSHSQTRPKGDGLGLSLCREIAHAHGSTLTLHTGPENWVTFTATWKSA